MSELSDWRDLATPGCPSEASSGDVCDVDVEFKPLELASVHANKLFK